jgi:pimeloyl-ACP methyl ester carboxylesterase
MNRPRKRTQFAGCLFTLVGAFSLVALGIGLTLGDDEGVSRATINHSDSRVISYLRAGDADAPRIVYVHGSPGNARAWLNYLKDPIPGHESIAPDRPGFGQTSPAGPIPSLQEQAAAIEPFLVEHDGKWPILVGHSFGGTIVSRVAVDYPDRVGGLVILSGPLDPSNEKLHWYQQAGEFWFVPRLLPRGIRNSNRELRPLKAELEVLEPLLGAIQCPVAILHGKNDALAPVSNVDYLKARLPEGVLRKVVLFEDRNHLIPLSEEAAIREAIEQVAAGVSQPDGSDGSD